MVRLRQSEPSQIGSISKAVEVLETVAAAPCGLSVRELASILAYPRSTVYDICKTLTGQGLLHSVPGQGYQAGPRLLELGGGFFDRVGLLSASREALASFPNLPGFTVQLAQLVGSWMYYLAHRSFAQHSSSDWHTFRAFATRDGSGHAALSVLSGPELEAFLTSIPRELDEQELGQLKRRLERVKHEGVSMTKSADDVSIAAPICTFSGSPLGAVSVSGPASFFTREVLHQCRSLVLTTAMKIEHAMFRTSDI